VLHIAARNYGTVSVSATFANGKLKAFLLHKARRSWSQQSLTVLVAMGKCWKHYSRAGEAVQRSRVAMHAIK
jgi:hypothetical protein